MRLLDLNSPWGILPDKLLEISEIYKTHLRGEKIDYKAIEARLPIGNQMPKELYSIDNGIAIIPIQGPITQRGGGIFSFLFGSSSVSEIEKAFLQAIDDPEVKGIIFAVDSPGGTVSGVQELSNTIYQARGKKPVIAYTDGMMASAAYWIASAADKIYISGDTNMVGSIGVVMMHVDYSEQNRQYGEKVTEIYAGKYKRIASSNKPLTDEGKQYLQDQVDYLYEVFVGAVATNRGVSVETVLSDMADGKTFLGKQALDAGLVDGVSAMSGLIDAMTLSPAQRLRASIEADVRKKTGGNAWM